MRLRTVIGLRKGLTENNIFIESGQYSCSRTHEFQRLHRSASILLALDNSEQDARTPKERMYLITVGTTIAPAEGI